MELDSILKGRALYLYNIAILLGMDDDIDLVSDEFVLLLGSFFREYVLKYPEVFQLVYKFNYDMEKGNVTMLEPSDSELIVQDYCIALLEGGNSTLINKIYDIGSDKVDKITNLSEMFMSYVRKLYVKNNKLIKIKQ